MWGLSNFEWAVAFVLLVGVWALVEIRNDVRSICRMVANELNRRDRLD